MLKKTLVRHVPEVKPLLQSDQPLRIPWAVRLLWLIGPSLILLASFTLVIGGEREVVLPVVRVRLPEMCTMYSRLGLDCPGCGLTRSFIHMSAGRLGEAWRLNPVGIPGYIYVAFQIPIAAIHFVPMSWGQRLRNSKLISNWGWLNQWMFVALMIALPAQWIIRMLWKGLV